MAAALASVNGGPVPAPQPGSGARVQASATVIILRAETASAETPRGGLVRHVKLRSDGSQTIVFE